MSFLVRFETPDGKPCENQSRSPTDPERKQPSIDAQLPTVHGAQQMQARNGRKDARRNTEKTIVLHMFTEK